MDDKVLIKKVAIRNGIMSFYEKGNGFPIILIHGGISNSFVWKYQINELAKKYHVFSINRKYVNCNENTPIARYSLEENVEDLVELINVLGIKETYLVGHSYSGFMLLQLAKRNLPCIKAMIVAEPAIPQLLFNDKKRPGPIDIMRLIKTDRKALKSIIKFRNESIVPMDSAIKHGSEMHSIDLFLRGVEGQENTQFDDEIKKMMYDSFDLLRLDSNQNDFPDYTSADARKISIPVQITKGDKSPRFLQYISEILSRTIPKSRIDTIQNASHFMFLENPIMFSNVVMRFLNDQDTE